MKADSPPAQSEWLIVETSQAPIRPGSVQPRLHRDFALQIAANLALMAHPGECHVTKVQFGATNVNCFRSRRQANQ
jgi:hypothetical protein